MSQLVKLRLIHSNIYYTCYLSRAAYAIGIDRIDLHTSRLALFRMGGMVIIPLM
jgi:hypothetical protein